MQGSEGVAAEGQEQGRGGRGRRGWEQEPALGRASRFRIGTLNSFCMGSGEKRLVVRCLGPRIKAEGETRHIQAQEREAVCRVGSELIGLHTKAYPETSPSKSLRTARA